MTSKAIKGRQVVLPNGAVIWGGLLLEDTGDTTLVWRARNEFGKRTDFMLSRPAFEAMMAIYTALLGVDQAQVMTYDMPSHPMAYAQARRFIEARGIPVHSARVSDCAVAYNTRPTSEV